ncbi:methyltransferase [Cellulomonas sp. DKR-3]|uniref:Methyltransferase n=1 Tax=Cellulomonas fulva TaxID=2835530 RepID=A0ABS5TWW6_9CELL|nr:methyltransferase [Cellulomonas fulva]MBT0993641.1 methyltransferase [Cellulomonas fulva]
MPQDPRPSRGGRASSGRARPGGRGRPAPDRRAPDRRTRGTAGARPAATARVELTFLPGLADVLSDEVGEVLGARARPVVGRDDALVVDVTALAEVRRLRTAVAAFVVLHFDVPRPKALLSGEHLQRVVDAAYASLRVAGSSTFRFEAAGSDSSVFARLAAELAAATGLKHDEHEGELVVKVRRGARRPATDADPGWDVLVRVGPRPLSARTWRVTDYPGAVNATIAAAMVRLAGARDDERVLNLMCGSGTLLVERLLAAPAASAVGIDLADDALAAARDNLEAAGLARRASLVAADALEPGAWPEGTAPADLLLADPPWGSLHGSHAAAAQVHSGLLRAAHAAAAPGARLVVLTHEVKVMEAAVRDAAGLWRAREPLRVFAKGHHPRIWLLDRV